MQGGKPVNCASAETSVGQHGCPQIEKEALQIWYICWKVHHHICGRPLTIDTDHKPIGTTRWTLNKASRRLRLLVYDVQQYPRNIVYRKGTELVIADLLRRGSIGNGSAGNCTQNMQVLAIEPMSPKALEYFIRSFASDKSPGRNPGHKSSKKKCNKQPQQKKLRCTSQIKTNLQYIKICCLEVTGPPFQIVKGKNFPTRSQLVI